MKYYLIQERKKISHLGGYWDWVEPISFGYDADGDLKTIICNTSGGTIWELEYPSDYNDFSDNFIQLDDLEDNAEYIYKLNQKMEMLRKLSVTMAVDIKEFEEIYLHSGKTFNQLEEEYDSIHMKIKLKTMKKKQKKG